MLSLATMGYLDVSLLCQLQVYQSMLMSLVQTSCVGALAPRRLMYDEELEDFIYVSEMLGVA